MDPRHYIQAEFEIRWAEW